jgi:hypothetical protein
MFEEVEISQTVRASTIKVNTTTAAATMEPRIFNMGPKERRSDIPGQEPVFLHDPSAPGDMLDFEARATARPESPTSTISPGRITIDWNYDVKTQMSQVKQHVVTRETSSKDPRRDLV